MNHTDTERIVAIVRDAGRLVEQIAKDGFQTMRKADHSVVTGADLAADVLIRDALRESFPNDAILTEEHGLVGPPDAENIWVVDPIDGTRAYAKGRWGYCVMVGKVRQARPVFGVIYDSYRDVLWMGGERIPAVRVDPDGVVDLPTDRHIDRQNMRLITSSSFPDELYERLVAETGFQKGRRVNSVGIKVGMLCDGDAEVYFSYHPLSFWDTVAPCALAVATGATYSLLDGSNPSYKPSTEPESWVHDQPFVFSVGEHHSDVVEAIRRAVELS